jgi:methionine biosynthesis protein MetW
MIKSERLHGDYDTIVSLVEPGSTALDLGCGDGELLSRLKTERNVHGRGVDIEEAMILRCIDRGISVFQGDLDEGLKDYGSGSYDYVILNQTLQMIHRPVMLLKEMLRVGKRAIVNFPNFGYIVNRIQLGLGGRMPVNKHIPFQWHDTPNIHFCTRRDFVELCRELSVDIMEEIALRHGRVLRLPGRNVFATEILLVLRGEQG